MYHMYYIYHVFHIYIYIYHYRQTGGKTGDPKQGTRSTKPCQHEQAHFCALEPLRQAAVVAPQPDGCTCVKGELPYYKQRQSTYLTLLDMWCYSVQYIGVTTWKVGTHS